MAKKTTTKKWSKMAKGGQETAKNGQKRHLWRSSANLGPTPPCLMTTLLVGDALAVSAIPQSEMNISLIGHQVVDRGGGATVPLHLAPLCRPVRRAVTAKWVLRVPGGRPRPRPSIRRPAAGGGGAAAAVGGLRGVRVARHRQQPGPAQAVLRRQRGGEVCRGHLGSFNGMGGG